MKETVTTNNAPGAIGPYSQAIKAGGLVFCSGQIPIDPATGNFVSDVVAEQTEQVLKNLSEVLSAAGTSLDNVVKTTVFLADMEDFAEMNEDIPYALFVSMAGSSLTTNRRGQRSRRQGCRGTLASRSTALRSFENRKARPQKIGIWQPKEPDESQIRLRGFDDLS